MSIERPSQADIYRFMVVQDGKKHTGNWYSAIPYVLAISAGVTAFTISLYSSMVPTGIVPRILYEKTLSLPRRHLRHFMPAIIGVGSLYAWDCYHGVWSSKE